MAGGAQDRDRLDHAAGSVGQHVEITGLIHGPPQRRRPLAGLGGFQKPRRHVVAEQAQRAVVEDRIAHRRIALSPSAQPETAGDDAAQDFARAAAQGPGRRVQHRLGERRLQPVAAAPLAGRRRVKTRARSGTPRS